MDAMEAQYYAQKQQGGAAGQARSAEAAQPLAPLCANVQHAPAPPASAWQAGNVEGAGEQTYGANYMSAQRNMAVPLVQRALDQGQQQAVCSRSVAAAAVGASTGGTSTAAERQGQASTSGRDAERCCPLDLTGVEDAGDEDLNGSDEFVRAKCLTGNIVCAR